MDENRIVERMPQTIGRYQVQASIGFGAMGAVYKAFDPLIKRTLAIKTIRLDIPKNSPQYQSFLERFYHEARISGTLSHPNIVTLFDIGEEGNVPFLAMEYVEGETIGGMIERRVRFDPERVVGLVSQIAAAIDYAHSRGVIHRDIKPSNIILAEGDAVKVTDFGIAKLADTDMTQSGALLGTPSYMSPEQAMGEKLDGRSDIFSLGICAFEMLSGEQPFPGANVTSILYKLVHMPPVEPANLEMNGLVPQKWHEVFGRVLAKKPDERYQTGSAFVQDLELCLGSWFGAAMGEDGVVATVAMEPVAEPTRAMPMVAPLEPTTILPALDVSAKGAPPPPARGPSDEPTVLIGTPPPLAPRARPARAPARPETVPVASPPLNGMAHSPQFGTAAVTQPAPRPPRALVAKPDRRGLPLLLVLGGGAVVFLAVALGVAAIVMKARGAAGPETATNPVTTNPVVTQAPAPSPSGPATLVRVKSEPSGAMILVDGEAKGLTPLDVTGVPLGAHEVKVELSGYESKSRLIELSRTALEASVDITLAAPTSASPVMGVAEIVSSPSGAAVLLGRRMAGTTPLRDLKMKVGSYRVELRKDGFEVFAGTLSVEAGKAARLEATLVPVAAAATASPPPPVVADRVYGENEVERRPRRIQGPSSPAYPQGAPALKSGDRVSVSISWVVTETGEVTDPEIKESAGKAVDDSVLEMLRQQRYEPGTKSGAKVKVRLLRIFTFRSG